METILVVNAGSSSLKFQVFALGAVPDLKCLIKGQIDGIGTRPRLARAGGRQEALDRQRALRGPLPGFTGSPIGSS